MRKVNPELYLKSEDADSPMRKADPGFADGVAKLFGTSDPNVRQAVEEFLALGPASFDHHRLRIVAASAAAFDDMNHVAHMIRQLGVTQVELAARPIDLDAAREQFAVSLPKTYREQTRRALVLDLVRDTTLEVLQNSPISHVPEAGRAMVRAVLHKKLRGDESEVSAALQSPFFGAEHWTTVLDRLESKIERAENEQADGGARLPSGREMKDIFIYLTRTDAPASYDEHLHRAWQLYQRCSPLPEVLDYAARSPTLLAAEGRSVFDAIERRLSEPDGRKHGATLLETLISSPSLPEDVARDVVASVVRSAIRPRMQCGDPRIALLRYDHYRRSDVLMPTPSADDLDGAVVDLPPGELTSEMIHAVESEWAVEALVNVSSQMHESECLELMVRPDLTARQLHQMVDDMESATRRFEWLGDWEPYNYKMRPITYLTKIFNKFDDDEQLADFVDKLSAVSGRTGESARHLTELAACSASAGRRINQMLGQQLDSCPLYERREALMSIAEVTASAYIQEALVATVVASKDAEIAWGLNNNLQLRKQPLADIRTQFPWCSELSYPDMSSVLGPDSRERFIDLLFSGDVRPDIVRHAILMSSIYSKESRLADELLAAGAIADETVVDLSGDADQHIALLVATHPRANEIDAESRFTLPAKRRLSDTAYAIEHEGLEMPPDRRLNSWDKLPRRGDTIFERTALHDLLEGQKVAGLTITLPRSSQELRDLSNSMHNCLDGYIPEVAAGEYVIAVARSSDDTYAVSLRVTQEDDDDASVRTRQRVEVEEINSKFNAGNVPEPFTKGIKDLIARFNASQLVEPDLAVVEPELQQAPAVVEAEVGRSDDVSEAAPNPPALRAIRPAARRRLPDLGEPRGEANVDSDRGRNVPLANAPSLLGGNVDVENHDSSDVTIIDFAEVRPSVETAEVELPNGTDIELY